MDGDRDRFEVIGEAPGRESLEPLVERREPLTTRRDGELRRGPYEDSYLVERGYPIDLATEASPPDE